MANVGAKQITLTYLNIRQSIAILILKIFLLDFILASAVIIFYLSLVQGEQFISGISSNIYLFLGAFAFIGFIKIALTIYVILLWLNEYYEITPDYIMHKHGIIFKKQEHYRLDHVRGMDVVDTFLGEMLNFGTIVLYDIRLNKYLDMYLIHNPRRYAKVLKQLRPHIELKEDHVWNPLVQKEEIGEAEEIHGN